MRAQAKTIWQVSSIKITEHRVPYNYLSFRSFAAVTKDNHLPNKVNLKYVEILCLVCIACTKVEIILATMRKKNKLFSS